MSVHTIAQHYRNAAIDATTQAIAAKVAARFSMGSMRALGAAQATLFAASVMDKGDTRRQILEAASASFMALAAEEAMTLVLGSDTSKLHHNEHPMAGATSSSSSLQQILGPTQPEPRLPTPDEILQLVNEEYAKALAEESAFAKPHFVFFNTQGSTTLAKDAPKTHKLKVVQDKHGKSHYVEHTRSEFYNVQQGSEKRAAPLLTKPALTGTSKIKVNGKTIVVKREDVHAAINKADANRRGTVGGLAPFSEQMPEGKKFNTQTSSFVATEEVATPVNTPPATTAGDTWPKKAKPAGRKALRCPRCNKEGKSNKFTIWSPEPIGALALSEEQTNGILWGGSELCDRCRKELTTLLEGTASAAPTDEVQKIADAVVDAGTPAPEEAKLAELQKEADKVAEQYIVAAAELEAQEKKLVEDAGSINLMGDAAPDNVRQSLEDLKFNVQKSRKIVQTLEQQSTELATKRSALCAGVPVETATSKVGTNVMQQALGNAKTMKRGKNRGR